MPFIPVSKVVEIKRIIGERGAEVEERQSG
jgi:hypothetical protein